MSLQAGELALLKAIRERFSRPLTDPDRGVITGIGDDAAVIRPQNGQTLVTTDLMHEGVHFDLSYTAPFHLGFKLVSVNVSDIMAMGGTPRYLFLNLSLSSAIDDEAFEEFFDGIAAACAEYDTVLAGGDLSAARHDIVVSATAIGTADRPITRRGASEGDALCVTGCLGDSGCGLEILKRLAPESRRAVRRARFTHALRSDAPGEDLPKVLCFSDEIPCLDWGSAAPLIQRHLMPIARRAEPLRVCATAMIDVSDGLFIDLSRLCDESGVGAKVYLDKIPVSDQMRTASRHLGLDPLTLASSGGEDYELLFTVPSESLEDIRSLGYPVTHIGEITRSERLIVDGEGRVSPLDAKGYQHFAS